jgi:hypothetical protein
MRAMRGARLGALTLVLGAIVALLGAGSALAAGPISGTVTNASAQPLAGIEVCAVSFGIFGEECAQTDGAGEYSISGSGAGVKVHFYARENSAPGYAPQWYPGVGHSEEAPAVTEAEIAGGIDAVLAQGAEIEGETLDQTNEAPIEGVEICPTPSVFRAGEVTACARSDANGEFALRDLGADTYTLEFFTAGEVNYVDQDFTVPLAAGASIQTTAYLRRGVEVKGTLTEAGTGLPVEGLGPPYSGVPICAVEIETGERIKCTSPGPGGAWSIPGITPGQLFTISFAVDSLEEGHDINPDGYVRQYWDGVTELDQATAIGGSGGSVLDHKDAVLTRGDEILPVTGPPAGEPGGGAVGGAVVTLPPPSSVVPVAPRPLGFHHSHPKLVCKKGFRKVTQGGQRRCVKIKAKHRPRKHQTKAPRR